MAELCSTRILNAPTSDPTSFLQSKLEPLYVTSIIPNKFSNRIFGDNI